MSDTPETDAFVASYSHPRVLTYFAVPADCLDLARKFERQRDTALAQLKEARDMAEQAAELLVWASWLQSVSPKARAEIDEVVTKLRNFAPPASQP